MSSCSAGIIVVSAPALAHKIQSWEGLRAQWECSTAQTQSESMDHPSGVVRTWPDPEEGHCSFLKYVKALLSSASDVVHEQNLNLCDVSCS